MAQNSEPIVRFELLKKLGDRSLYISGFFADSLQRKVVDVDYYAEMGGVAYGALADSAVEEVSSSGAVMRSTLPEPLRRTVFTDR